MLKRLWKRYVRGRPDDYQAYISLPARPDRPDRPSFGEVHEEIEAVETVFEGRLDVYARMRRLAIVTDRVPREAIDVASLDAALESLEALYAETHSFVRLEKWQTVDDRLVKTYVVVPVKPLFPRDDARAQPQSAVD